MHPPSSCMDLAKAGNTGTQEISLKLHVFPGSPTRASPLRQAQGSWMTLEGEIPSFIDCEMVLASTIRRSAFSIVEDR